MDEIRTTYKEWDFLWSLLHTVPEAICFVGSWQHTEAHEWDRVHITINSTIKPTLMPPNHSKLTIMMIAKEYHDVRIFGTLNRPYTKRLMLETRCVSSSYCSPTAPYVHILHDKLLLIRSKKTMQLKHDILRVGADDCCCRNEWLEVRLRYRRTTATRGWSWSSWSIMGRYSFEMYLVVAVVQLLVRRSEAGWWLSLTAIGTLAAAKSSRSSLVSIRSSEKW